MSDEEDFISKPFFCKECQKVGLRVIVDIYNYETMNGLKSFSYTDKHGNDHHHDMNFDTLYFRCRKKILFPEAITKWHEYKETRRQLCKIDNCNWRNL